MTALPPTPAEWADAQALYAVFVGPDLAHRLPLRCQGPWQQRQWLAVARRAAELIEARALERVGVRATATPGAWSDPYRQAGIDRLLE